MSKPQADKLLGEYYQEEPQAQEKSPLRRALLEHFVRYGGVLEARLEPALSSPQEDDL